MKSYLSEKLMLASGKKKPVVTHWKCFVISILRRHSYISRIA